MADEYISKIQITEEGDEVPIRDIGAVRYAELFDLIYPVGSIYMSATLSTPEAVAALFGGIWERWGEGRVPVGVDTADSDFSTSEKSDGAKSHSYTPAGSNSGGSVGNTTLTTTQIPSHSHTYNKASTPTGTTVVSASGTTTAMYSTDATRIQTFGDKVINALTVLKAKTGASFTNPTLHVTNGKSVATGISGGSHNHSVTISSTSTGNTGSSGAHNHTLTPPTFTGTAATMSHLQPYITCYMYKRTAL